MSLPAGLQAPTRTRVTVAQPALGADWSFTIPGGTWAKLMCGTTVLTCSAVAGNRRVGTIIKDAGGNSIGQLQAEVSGNDPRANFVTPVNYMTSHNWQAGSSAAIVSLNQCATLTLSPFVLPPGYTLGSATAGMLSGDRYSAIQLVFGYWTQEPFIDAFGPMWRAR